MFGEHALEGDVRAALRRSAGGRAGARMMPAGPRVSVAIPLYRSARFLDRIVHNIEVLDHPDVEVIVSDRHGEDDAIQRIAERFRGDARVRTIAAADRLTWASHYNWLLREARGDYVMWMPHDDEFPAGYVSTLATALDDDPAAVLAYGRIRRVDEHGVPLMPEMSPLPQTGDGAWSAAAASRLLLHRDTEQPFRGVFRRNVVLAAGLWIRETRDAMSEDAYWTFALALRGPFRFVPASSCRKYYYAASTHARWGPMRLAHIADGRRVMRAYVADAPLPAPERRGVLRAIDRWTAQAAMGVAARTVGIPAVVRRAIQRASSRALAGRHG